MLIIVRSFRERIRVFRFNATMFARVHAAHGIRRRVSCRYAPIRCRWRVATPVLSHAVLLSLSSIGCPRRSGRYKKCCSTLLVTFHYFVMMGMGDVSAVLRHAVSSPSPPSCGCVVRVADVTEILCHLTWSVCFFLGKCSSASLA